MEYVSGLGESAAATLEFLPMQSLACFGRLQAAARRGAKIPIGYKESIGLATPSLLRVATWV
jgi:hypothetical protein